MKFNRYPLYVPPPPKGVDINDTWWRADINHYSVADEWGEHSHTTVKITWQVFVLDKATPKGVWIRGFLTGRVFVLGTAARQRACPTPELALADAIARKERHIAGCKARLSRAEGDLKLLQSGMALFNQSQKEETLDG